MNVFGAEQVEQLVEVLLVIGYKIFRMVVCIILRILLDEDLLDQADVFNVLVVFFLRVYIGLFNAHNEFIKMIIIGLSDFLSEEADGLEVADMHCLLALVRLIKYSNVEWLDI